MLPFLILSLVGTAPVDSLSDSANPELRLSVYTYPTAII